MADCLTRIALFLPNLEGGGAERVMLALSREFANLGYQVDLVVIQATGVLRELLPDKVRLIDLGARPFGASNTWLAIRVVLRLARWLQRERPTVLLSTVTGMNLAVILAHILSRSPARLVIREGTTLSNFRSRLRILAMRLLYPRADIVVAVSPTVERQLVSVLKVPEARVRCIPNAVDREFIRQQAKLPNRHPWLDDPCLKTVVAVGRLSPAKDYPTLLRAFSLIPRTMEARLLVVGEGPERVPIESLVRSLDLEDRVQLVGFDLNPWRWMSRADVFVLSSRWEGQPNSLLEALVLGCPSVITAFDDSAANIVHDFGLMAVPAGDAHAMAESIYQQLENPNAPRGLEKILAFDQVMSLYLELIQRRAKCA